MTTMTLLERDPALELTEADILHDLPSLGDWAMPAPSVRELRLASEVLDQLPALAGFQE